MKILVTGGTGYIGSHTVVELLNEGHDVVILDNLSNSDRKVVDRIEKITGLRPVFYEADILDKESLDRIFDKEDIEAVIHFAGLKAVGESVEKPLLYYENNISGTINLLKSMNKHSCKNIIFSSSAIMMDQCAADSEWNAVLLRYFNPIGAHESGTIGENPNGIPNNLMPYVTQVAVGRLERLGVFGDDYDTPDGTGVRDYIHVVDLARGHLAALKKLETKPGLVIYNLGTGTGYSVLDMVNTFEKVNGVKVPYKIVDRRPGDIAECFADPSKAYKELGWKAELGIEDMMRDSYNFILKCKEDK